MNPSLSEHWHTELMQSAFDSIELTSFDIWAGLNPEEKHFSSFKPGEFDYMTLLYTTKNVSLEHVWQHSPPFLNHHDRNVDRLMKSEEPVLHCKGLIRKESQPVLERFADQHNFLHPKTCTVLVPVSREVESRWKAVLSISFIVEPEHGASDFVYRYRTKLLQWADKVYQLWRAFEGNKFNLYKVRGLLCENAVKVAELLIQGLSGKKIAECLHITSSGVEYHIDTMRQAFGANNRSQLIAELFRRGIVC
ncbi:helix-turn-helix transcriptional regulator [Vibrio sp. HN007]|uniref:helix-turn-helix transcriptional regulator n=1 Tax=Vibrio iocasae TaxID=3098914 RepID=UPI0035D420E4